MFSHIFWVKIIAGKGIGRIYKYNQRNWPYPSPTTSFVIPQRSDTSIKTQQASASDASIGAHDLSPYGLYQSTNHHGNTVVNDNDDSQSFGTLKKHSCSSYCFGDKTTTMNKPYSFKLPPPGK